LRSILINATGGDLANTELNVTEEHERILFEEIRRAVKQGPAAGFHMWFLSLRRLFPEVLGKVRHLIGQDTDY
jgi:hypothetical protein